MACGLPIEGGLRLRAGAEQQGSESYERSSGDHSSGLPAMELRY
jgi:hypothetical protein